MSLNISIEVIKGFLGIFLGFDDKMYCEAIDQKCGVNNVSILDELGKVDYILTDKTGTLTANEMVFKYLSLGNLSFSSEQMIIESKILSTNRQFQEFWLGLLICQDVVCDPETH